MFIVAGHGKLASGSLPRELRGTSSGQLYDVYCRARADSYSSIAIFTERAVGGDLCCYLCPSAISHAVSAVCTTVVLTWQHRSLHPLLLVAGVQQGAAAAGRMSRSQCLSCLQQTGPCLQAGGTSVAESTRWEGCKHKKGVIVQSLTNHPRRRPACCM